MSDTIKAVVSNLSSSSGAAVPIDHPYYPIGVTIVGYLANETSVPTLLITFFGGFAVILYATYLVTLRLRPAIARAELLAVMWFVLSGLIHLFFEGYFSVNHARMGGLQTYFGQLWKEYALSDSRYLTRDAFVLCMESCTAFLWGPGCLTIAAMIAFDHPMRHPLQIIVSMGQLYGLVLYYATSMFDHYMLGVAYSRPEAWYFWGYYVIMNAFWMFIPGALIWDSFHVCSRAIAASQAKQTGKKKI